MENRNLGRRYKRIVKSDYELWFYSRKYIYNTDHNGIAVTVMLIDKKGNACQTFYCVEGNYGKWRKMMTELAISDLINNREEFLNEFSYWGVDSLTLA